MSGPYATLETRPADTSQAIEKVFPLWTAVNRLTPLVARVLQGSAMDAAHAVFALESGAVAARLPAGRGDVILLSCPEIFQNRLLGTADHLALLEHLAGSGRAVHFDEFVHGIETQAGIMEILRRWGLGPLLGLAALAAIVAFWRRRKRLGPAEDDHRETRVEAVDFVDSLAMLYHRALGRRQTIRMYIKAFEQSAAAQLGLRGEALQAKIRELLPVAARPVSSVRNDLGGPEFRRTLQAINNAFRRLEDAKHRRNR